MEIIFVFYYSASLENTTGSDRAPSVASTQSSSSASQSSTPLPGMTPLSMENGDKLTLEDKEIISITNGHDYANVNIVGKSGTQDQQASNQNSDHFHEDTDHLVLKVDTSSENGLCISMVGTSHSESGNDQCRNFGINGKSENNIGSSSHQKVFQNVSKKSPSKSKARPMIPIRTVSLPGEAEGQNIPVMSTFKPKETKTQQSARLTKVSTVRDKV